jgi:dolichyl-diphosphooligosaccharide--protein glycosyltransferase
LLNLCVGSPPCPTASQDPYFNYRATKYLAEEGFSSFLNWQDDRTWHPIGRVVGGTVYPGLMVTAGVMHYLLNLVNITMNVRNICVFLAPLFAANTAIATYLMTSEVTGRSTAGLIAAAMVGIVPSYISRSVAGSYDNEGVAIFALIFTFYLWVKAVVTGRLIWGMAVALAYFYMVAAWGGYVFIINVIPIYTVVMIAAGRYSPRLYIAYSTFYVVGSLLSMQVPFVGFNVVKQAESAASHGVFVMIQLVALYAFVTKQISGAVIRRLLWLGVAVVIVGSAALLIAMQLMGYTQWTGRSLTLLDPTYAKKYIPIIASVSEHQPTSWTSFFFDLHVAVPLAPVGLYFLFQRLDGTQGDARIFMIIYGTISWYFAGVMVRLMLTLAPAACMLGAIGFSGLLSTFSAHLKIAWRGQAAAAKEAPARAAEVADKPAGAGAGAAADASGSVAAAAGVARPSKQAAAKEAAVSPSTMPPVMSLAVLAGTGAMLLFYTLHATYVSSEAYSSPSIVLASKRADGSRVIFDDFREAYYWCVANRG